MFVTLMLITKKNAQTMRLFCNLEKMWEKTNLLKLNGNKVIS